ncbi:MAG: hypothetical protein GX074_04925 [Erysipelothrix sp.]|nr:hypothetical protein [Erysipelothrix sp.]
MSPESDDSSYLVFMENQVLVAASIFADVFDYRQEGNVLYILMKMVQKLSMKLKKFLNTSKI